MRADPSMRFTDGMRFLWSAAAKFGRVEGRTATPLSHGKDSPKNLVPRAIRALREIRG